MAYFDGAYLTIVGTASKIMKQPFTISFKFVAEEQWNNTGILGINDSGLGFRQVYMGSRDTPFLQITLCNGEDGRLESSPVVIGQMYTAIIVVKDGQEYLYIDGLLNKQDAFTLDNFNMWAGDMTIGIMMSDDQSSCFKGYIGDVRVYDRALTDEEITKLSNKHAEAEIFTTPHDLTSQTSDSRYTISQSSTVDTKRYAWRVFDGSLDPETGCAHTGISTNNWWKIKFNEGPVYVNKLTFTCRDETHGFTDKATSFNLQGSNDDSTWETITSFSIIQSSASVNEVQVDSAAAYQYWRIIDSSSSSHYLVIGELQFEYQLNLTAMITSKDQKINGQLSTHLDYQIEYKVYPEDLQPTFTIIEGELPAGLYLDEYSGIIMGTPEEEFTGDVKIRISAPKCEAVEIIISITIRDYLITSNNLTSNDSNSEYTVSQRSTSSGMEAWRAMDGDSSTYSRTQYQLGITDWWQIDFKMPVFLKGIVVHCDNEGSYGTYLEGSDDGSTWTQLDATKFPDNTTTERTYNFDTPYRYYRLINERAYYYIQFYEIQFMYKPLSDIILANNQTLQAKINEEVNYQIDYKVYPGDLQPTFNIIEGELPAGLQLDTYSGIIQGTQTEEFTGEVKIQIYADGVQPVDIILSIKILDFNPIISDGLTLYMPFTKSVTQPLFGETFVSDNLPVLNVVDGEACTTFNPGQYLYNDSNNYWTVGSTGSNLTMVFDIYVPSTISTEQAQPRFIVVGADPNASYSYAELGYCYRKSDNIIRNII